MLPGLAVMAHSSDAASGGVAISDTTARKLTWGAPSVATYTLSSDGQVLRNGVSFETWLKSGAAAGYDVKATVLSGAVSSGTTGSWLNLASTRSWSVNQPTPGSNACTLRFDLALTGTTVPIDSATVTIDAEYVSTL